MVALDSLKNVQIEAISKQNELKLKLKELTDIDMANVTVLEDLEGLKMHTVNGVPEIIMGSYGDEQLAFLTLTYSYVDFFKQRE